MKLPLILIVALFGTGILLSGRLPSDPRIAFIAILIFVLAGFVLLFRRWVLAAAVAGGLAWLSLGAAGAGFERIARPANLASTLIESGKLDSSVPLRWHGYLRENPLRLPWGTRYDIRLDRVESASGVLPVTGGLRLTSYHGQPETQPPETPSNNQLDGATHDASHEAAAVPADASRAMAGDSVEVLARALPAKNFGYPGSFDFRAYLALQDVNLEGTLRNDSLLTITGPPRLTPAHLLARIRGRLLISIDELFSSSPDRAALARAMLLGDRTFVDHDRVVEFQQTGVYHVLVLAGLHVGALTVFLIWVGRRLRITLFWRTMLVFAALSFYAGIVQDRPPILRAVLMAAIFLAARLLFRRMDLLNVAAMAALILLTAKPSEIVDTSFLLSFAAVGVIGALAVPWIAASSQPILRGLARLMEVHRDVSHAPRIIQMRIELRALADWLAARIPHRAAPLAPYMITAPLRGALYLWELIVLSTVLQFAMMPLLAHYFHRVTIAGPLVNIPAVLLTGIIVPLGFLTLASALVWHALAQQMARVLGLLLFWLDATVQWFAGWHRTSYRIPGPPLFVILVFGLTILALAAFILSHRRMWQWISAFALLLLAVVIATYPFPPDLNHKNMEVTVLDVGQGDSSFVSFPGGQTMLVDAGGMLGSFHSGEMRSGLDIGEDVVSTYLWSRGLKRVDVVALTHAHQDHLGGLASVLRNFAVGELWVGHDENIAAYRQVLEIARERGVKIVPHKEGDTFARGAISGKVLWPADVSAVTSAKNDDSLVLRLTDGDQSILLTGDIERPSERKILGDEETVSAGFLKVAHHGSKTSTTDPFLAAAHPQFAAVSAGRDNPFGHPSPEVLDRLETAGVKVYRTDRDGAITATTDGHTLAMSTFFHLNP